MISWLLQSDGTFQRSGELPKGTRYVQVQALSDGGVWSLDGGTRKSASAGIALIEMAIAGGHVRRKGYRVVPAPSSSEETRARFAEVRAAHRRKRGLTIALLLLAPIAGAQETLRPLPPDTALYVAGIEAGLPVPVRQACYANAQRLTVASKGRIRYVEGLWQLSPDLTPVGHAWNTIDGRIVDVTAKLNDGPYAKVKWLAGTYWPEKEFDYQAVAGMSKKRGGVLWSLRTDLPSDDPEPYFKLSLYSVIALLAGLLVLRANRRSLLIALAVAVLALAAFNGYQARVIQKQGVLIHKLWLER